MEIININNEETAQYIWNEALQRSSKPFAALTGYEEAVKEVERKNEESYEQKYDDSELEI